MFWVAQRLGLAGEMKDTTRTEASQVGDHCKLSLPFCSHVVLWLHPIKATSQSQLLLFLSHEVLVPLASLWASQISKRCHSVGFPSELWGQNEKSINGILHPLHLSHFSCTKELNSPSAGMQPLSEFESAGNW